MYMYNVNYKMILVLTTGKIVRHPTMIEGNTDKSLDVLDKRALSLQKEEK